MGFAGVISGTQPRSLADVPLVAGGVPVLGHLPQFYRGFTELIARGTAAHGPLFWTETGFGARQLQCTDPAILELLKGREFSSSFYAEGFATLLEGTLFAVDGEEHRRIRGTMAPAFTPRQVRSSDVLRVVAEVVERHVDKWLKAGRIAVLAATQELTLEIIVRLIGIPPVDLGTWARHYQRYLLSALPGKTPLHWWARRSRDWLDRGLGAVLTQLRASGDTSTLVGAIANGRDENGELLPLAEVVPNIRLLALAGHETTANSLAWAVLQQARSPESQRRAAAEVEGVAELAALTVDVERFTWAERQLREAMRLYPPVHSLARRLVAPVTIAGVELPVGMTVSIPLAHFLRDPERWQRPNEYDPDRFTTRPRPNTVDTAMFGGGPHFCLGYHVAIAEGTLILLTLARALARAGKRMVPVQRGPLPGPIWLPVGHPPGKLAVRFV